jgi:hypothetical protein
LEGIRISLEPWPWVTPSKRRPGLQGKTVGISRKNGAGLKKNPPAGKKICDRRFRKTGATGAENMNLLMRKVNVAPHEHSGSVEYHIYILSIQG